MADRNFDDLAPRFKRNVYAGLKGDIRLAVLQRDFAAYLPQTTDQPLRVFDAGGGQGQMACYFAALGHDVLLCDISSEMLAMASASAAAADLTKKIEIVQRDIQTVSETQREKFEIVTCHAVLEWVDEPEAILTACCKALKPGGYLSLTYYNVNGLIYKNLLRTNYKKLKKQQWGGYRGSLTPTNPLLPSDVMDWLSKLPFNLICESGIRTFHDYVLNPDDRKRDPASVIEMELRYSQLMPYKHLGRYVHVLLQKTY